MQAIRAERVIAAAKNSWVDNFLQADTTVHVLLINKRLFKLIIYELRLYQQFDQNFQQNQHEIFFNRCTFYVMVINKLFMEQYTKSYRQPPKSTNLFHKNVPLQTPLRITNNQIKQFASSVNFGQQQKNLVATELNYTTFSNVDMLKSMKIAPNHHSPRKQDSVQQNSSKIKSKNSINKNISGGVVAEPLIVKYQQIMPRSRDIPIANQFNFIYQQSYKVFIIFKQNIKIGAVSDNVSMSSASRRSNCLQFKIQRLPTFQQQCSFLSGDKPFSQEKNKTNFYAEFNDNKINSKTKGNIKSCLFLYEYLQQHTNSEGNTKGNQKSSKKQIVQEDKQQAFQIKQIVNQQTGKEKLQIRLLIKIKSKMTEKLTQTLVLYIYPLQQQVNINTSKDAFQLNLELKNQLEKLVQLAKQKEQVIKKMQQDKHKTKSTVQQFEQNYNKVLLEKLNMEHKNQYLKKYIQEKKEEVISKQIKYGQLLQQFKANDRKLKQVQAKIQLQRTQKGAKKHKQIDKHFEIIKQSIKMSQSDTDHAFKPIPIQKKKILRLISEDHNETIDIMSLLATILESNLPSFINQQDNKNNNFMQSSVSSKDSKISKIRKTLTFDEKQEQQQQLIRKSSNKQKQSYKQRKIAQNTFDTNSKSVNSHKSKRAKPKKQIKSQQVANEKQKTNLAITSPIQQMNSMFQYSNFQNVNQQKSEQQQIKLSAVIHNQQLKQIQNNTVFSLEEKRSKFQSQQFFESSQQDWPAGYQSLGRKTKVDHKSSNKFKNQSIESEKKQNQNKVKVSFPFEIDLSSRFIDQYFKISYFIQKGSLIKSVKKIGQAQYVQLVTQHPLPDFKQMAKKRNQLQLFFKIINTTSRQIIIGLVTQQSKDLISSYLCEGAISFNLSNLSIYCQESDQNSPAVAESNNFLSTVDNEKSYIIKMEITEEYVSWIFLQQDLQNYSYTKLSSNTKLLNRIHIPKCYLEKKLYAKVQLVDFDDKIEIY